MLDLIVLLVHLITTVLRIAQPGGLRSVIAESVLIKHQLLIRIGLAGCQVDCRVSMSEVPPSVIYCSALVTVYSSRLI